MNQTTESKSLEKKIMCKVTEVKTLPDYQLWLRFDDGEEGNVDLSELASKGNFTCWTKPGVFENIRTRKQWQAMLGRGNRIFAPMPFI